MPQLLRNAFVGDGFESLFHSSEFFRLHADHRAGLYFEWVDEASLRAVVHFTEIAPGVWRSPGRGTYGGLQWKPQLALEELQRFFGAVEAELVAAGAQSIEILQPPMAYNPAASTLSTYLLHSRGYAMTRSDINQSVLVTGEPLERAMSRSRLRSLRNFPTETRRLPLEFLPNVYDGIAANRAAKGYTISMTLNQLRDMAQLFPDRMLLFGCGSGEKLSAGAVCLLVEKHIMYIFYWGDRPEYAAHSLITQLASEIYKFCQDNGLRLLDAGTSTIGSDPNHGLLQFKHSLGFTDSLKMSFRRQL